MNASHENSLRSGGLLFRGFSSMNLRSRIAVYYTGATAFLIALVFTAVYFIVERVVSRQFDDELRSEVSEILTGANVHENGFRSLTAFATVDIDDNYKELEEYEEHDRNEDRDELQGNADVEFIQIVDYTGRIFRKSENLFNSKLVFEPHRAETYFFNTKLGGLSVRQVQIPLVNTQGNMAGYLLIAVPMKNAIIVLRDLETVFFLSFPVIILTLFVLTRAIAGRSIRPVEKVIATAEQITQSDLDRRIALPYHRDELYRLSATINALIDRIQKAFLREKQFTADASHELKTPLASLKGTLEVLIRKPREREYYESKVQFCLNEINRMTVLVDQLLMLARYESTSIATCIETLILCRHVDDAIERMRHVAEEKRISFKLDYDETLRVAADPFMLGLILENILSNAVKYSPPGSSVKVIVAQMDNLVTCSISDNGIGIPDESIPVIFDRFYRVDKSRNSGTGGSGLGLSIVKKLADLQNISIATKSSPSEGTTFTLFFQCL
ncbi:MAG: HAMP domain-containing protein [Chlorobiaceae bacterium]|nr:HAMP domain-containing protein [Chlorobiaceae bacterium]NTV61848.1 HAMP domain-containing protein [Chlorobiaceae bacterium]